MMKSDIFVQDSSYYCWVIWNNRHTFLSK